MASIRKWLAIPDGGLLWGKITKPFRKDTTFCDTRLKAQIMRNEFLKTGNNRIKKEFRKIFSSVSEIMDKDDPSEMSAYSYGLIFKTDLDRVFQQRRKNAEVLSSILAPYVTLIQADPELCSLYVPFLVPNRDVIQEKLSRMGIFNTIIW